MTITVNGEKIPKKDIENEIAQLRDHYNRYVSEQNADGGDAQLREWSTENVIERVLVRQAAEASDIEIQEEEIAGLLDEAVTQSTGKAPTRSEIELQLKITKLMERVTAEAPEPTNSDVERYYEENINQFNAPERVNVSHIVKHLDQGQDRTQTFLAISNIREQLNKGTSFEELASANSDCPDDAGNLGYFARGEMVPEFENVVFNMKEGEISDVFETPFGFHIAKLIELVPAGPIPLEYIRENLKEKLKEEMRQKAMDDYIDGRKAESEICGLAPQIS